MNELKEKNIDINVEIVQEIERLHYAYENYKDIIMTCLDLHKLDIDDSFLESEVFTSYEHKMNKAFAEYNVAKSELENKYVPKEDREMGCMWNLNFATNQLEITKR